jgi:MoaA/NifB/PqqE/SkfB family radical SAM enzyme
LEITNVCNLACEMCPRHHVDVPHEHMDFGVFKQIVDRLDGTEEISLVGLGEPFCHPRIFDAIAYCKQRGMIAKVTTNGLMFNSEQKLEQLIESGLDTLSVSIERIEEDGTSDDKVHRNTDALTAVRKLIELKKARGVDHPKIVFQSVMVQGKFEDLAGAISWGAEQGVDRVNVLRMTKYFETGLERPDELEERQVFSKLAQLRKELPIRIDCMQDQFYEGWKGALYKRFKYLLRLDSYCVRLLDYPYITLQGDVIPCCVLQDITFGNLLEKSMDEIWTGEAICDFRRNHDSTPTCSTCDNMRLKHRVR